MVFLTAIPSEPDLQVADTVIQVGLRMWLGIPVDPEGRTSEEVLKRCQCKAGQRAAAQASAADIGCRDADNHLINCLIGGGPIVRHDMLVREINKMARAAGIQTITTMENRAAHLATGNGGPDIDLQSYPDANSNAFLEVSIINPSQDAQERCFTHAFGSSSIS